ncbi:unnamed protein product [Lampetra fluviatilis]
MSANRGRARWAQLLERVSLRERIFSKRPLTVAPYRPRLSTPDLPPHVWSLFHRQADALQLARSAAPAQEVHTFAFERPNQATTGTRTFLVTSYSEFWHYYHVASHQAHYYEVIPEGSTCHLYFDVEFSRESNPDLDGGLEKMQELLQMAILDSTGLGISLCRVSWGWGHCLAEAMLQLMEQVYKICTCDCLLVWNEVNKAPHC